MSNVTSITDKIKETRASEEYESFLDIARLRMVCYQAHVDSGFDHDSAIAFTQLDTQDQLALEEEEEYMIVFEPDWGEKQ